MVFTLAPSPPSRRSFRAYKIRYLVESLRDWFPTTQPTLITQSNPGNDTSVTTSCACQSDPLLVDPSCVLCYCPESGNLDTVSEVSIEVEQALGLNRTSCADAVGLVKSTLVTFSLSGQPLEDGESFSCQCGYDPVLSPISPAFVMCRCPEVSSCVTSSDEPDSCTYAGNSTTATAPPTPASQRQIPTSSTYTHLYNENPSDVPLGAWGWCGGQFALCSLANCTTEYEGKETSDIGDSLAECGCLASDDLGPQGNGTTSTRPTSFVDPDFIMSLPLYQEFQDNCLVNSTSARCPGMNQAGICAAISTNSVYRGDYDLVSTFVPSPEYGGFSQQCNVTSGGRYAQCMTAACFKKTAFDGSPVTCYCPIYEGESFIVGGPVGSTPPCVQDGPYILSGVDSGASGSASKPASQGVPLYGTLAVLVSGGLLAMI